MPLVINGETIDPALIDSEFSQIKAYYEQQANVSCCERDDEFLSYAKDNITARVLLSQAAKRDLPRPDEDSIDTRLAELKEQAGGSEAFFYEQMRSLDPNGFDEDNWVSRARKRYGFTSPEHFGRYRQVNWP